MVKVGEDVKLADAPIVPAFRNGEQVDGVQVSVDGVEHAIDQSFPAVELATAYVVERLKQLQAEYGMRIEALPRKPHTAPAVVTAYRAFGDHPLD